MRNRSLAEHVDEGRGGSGISEVLRLPSDDGIVVFEGSGERNDRMLPEDVPAVLRDRLGAGATAALLGLVDRAIDERKPEMITAATERFERRLVEEIAAVRVLVAETEARLRESLARTEVRLSESLARTEVRLSESLAQTEVRLSESLAQTEVRLRESIAQTEVSVRDALGKSEGGLRDELSLTRVGMSKMEAGLRQEIAAGRVELLKWSFLFWIGQVLALAGFFAVMIRMVRPGV